MINKTTSQHFHRIPHPFSPQKLQRPAHALPDIRPAAVHEGLRREDRAADQEDPGPAAAQRRPLPQQPRPGLPAAAGLPAELDPAHGRPAGRADAGHDKGHRGRDLQRQRGHQLRDQPDPGRGQLEAAAAEAARGPAEAGRGQSRRGQAQRDRHTGAQGRERLLEGDYYLVCC